MGASGGLAEDVLQETFIAAYQAADRFRGEGSVRGWLFSIARNALRQSKRKKTDEPVSPDSLESLGLAAGWGAAPTAGFETRLAERDALERAIGSLAEEERDVLLLRDVEGLTGEEAAQALGVSLAAMKGRLHRARLRLAALLREGERDGV
jgi:RNA polymerase sigma-70 factor (ECF subfamily)